MLVKWFPGHTRVHPDPLGYRDAANSCVLYLRQSLCLCISLYPPVMESPFPYCRTKQQHSGPPPKRRGLLEASKTYRKT